MKPARFDLAAGSRAAMFGGGTGEGDVYVEAFDLTNATTIRAQVRPEQGATGTPIITLSLQAAGVQGVSLSFDPGIVDTDNGLKVGASIFRLQIDAGTLLGIDWGHTPPSEPLVLWYDLLITLPGVAEFPLFFGSFTVFPGVTI